MCAHVLATHCARAMPRTLTLLENRGRREDRVPAAPTAPAQKKLREARVDHRYRRIHSGLPCAMVYGLLRALPGEPACLPPSSARCDFRIVANLAPAWARQDHTT